MKVHLRKWLLKNFTYFYLPLWFFILGPRSKQVLRALPYAWDTKYTISQADA